MADHLLDARLSRLQAGDIHLHGQAFGGQHLDRLLRSLCIDICHDHARSLPGERLADGTADTTASAGHQGYLVG